MAEDDGGESTKNSWSGPRHEALRLVFNSPKHATTKLTALYAVRRKSKAQVRILKRENLIYLAPGKYTPTKRNRK